MDLARTRLTEERKALNANRPVGTWGKPLKLKDGSVDLLNWHFGIKAAATSKYALPEGETYRVRVKFPSTFPASPPGVAFDPPIFHTNVWPSGVVCLSLLLEQGHHPGAGHAGFWQASRSFADILAALAVFLDEPNPESIANADACALLKSDERAYKAQVATSVASYPARLAAKVAAEKR